MLLQILAYHQVSPCYLDFLSCIVADLLVAESDRFFGGFRHLKSFDNSRDEIPIPSLGRSSYHLQLTFALKAVFPPPETSSTQWEIKLSKEKIRFNRYEPNLKRLRHQLNKVRASNGSSLHDFYPSRMKEWLKIRRWPIIQAAIYHHFDVENGRAFWIVTAPGMDLSSAPAENVKSFKNIGKYNGHVKVRTENISKRFESSLDMILWLGQWSLSQFASSIDFLDKAIEEKVCKAARGATRLEEDFAYC